METEQNPDSPDAYRKVLQTNPADEYAASNLVVHLIGTMGVDEARKVCREYHAAGGASAKMAVNAAYLFHYIFADEEGTDIAHAMTGRAQRRDPEDAQLWLSGYRLACHKADYCSAMSYAAKAASLDPKSFFYCLRTHTPLTV